MEEEKNTRQSPNTKATDNDAFQTEITNQTQGEKRQAAKEPEIKAVDDEIVRKVVFSLCYISGILFFIPLIMYKDEDAKFHANEGLILLLLSVVGNVIFGVLTIVPVIGFIFAIVSGLYSALLLILGIIGIVYVVTDRRQPLPVIGAVKLIK